MNLLISHFFSSKLGKFLILSRSPAGMYTEPFLESSAGSISGRARKCGQIHSICFEKDWSTYFYDVKHYCRAVEIGDLRQPQLTGKQISHSRHRSSRFSLPFLNLCPAICYHHRLRRSAFRAKAPPLIGSFLLNGSLLLTPIHPYSEFLEPAAKIFAVIAFATGIRDA